MPIDREWQQKFSDGTEGKVGQALKEAKIQVLRDFASTFPDEYAWADGDKKIPRGNAYLASKIFEDMKRVFGGLFEPDLAREAAEFAARMYY